MLSVVEKLSFNCQTPEAKKAVAELFRFLGTLSNKERVALDNVVGAWYGATIDQDPLMSASDWSDDYALAARLLERLAQSNGHEVQLSPIPAKLEPVAAAGSTLVDTGKPSPAAVAAAQDVLDSILARFKRQMKADKSLRPSRINEIRLWLLSLPKGSVVDYNTVVQMWYRDNPARAGSAFMQLCTVDKALKRVGHARYQLVATATKKLRKGLKLFNGKKYQPPEKTIFDQ